MEEAASITIEELQLALQPVVEAVDNNTGVLSGLFAFLGVIAGLLVVKILFDRL